MKLIYVLMALLISTVAQAQTYTQMQWGMNKGSNPYGIGVNLNSTWFNVGTITTAGMLTWNNAQDFTLGGAYFGVPGASFDGVTDDTYFINTRITAIANAGGGTLYLPAGTAYISGPVLLKTNVAIIGASLGTTFSCAATCVGQAANSFVKGARFNGVNLTMRAGNTSDAILISSLQDSDIGEGKINGSGFRSVLNITSTAATGGSDNTNGNTIFNNFHDLDAYDAPSTYGVYVAGRYSASPPSPAQVVTINNFRSLKVRATNACYDFVKAADSNTLYDATCILGQTGARAFVNADDPVYAAVNNYVNNQRYYSPLISVASGAIGGSFTFFSGNWTYGIDAYGLLHDVNTVTNTVTPVNFGTGLSYCIRGQNIRPQGIVSAGNIYMADYCANYNGKGNSLTVAVATGFTVAAATTGPFNYLLLQPSTNIDGGTVELPCGVSDSTNFSISSTNNIKQVTVLPCAGDSISIGRNPFRVAANGTVTLKYLGASNFWISDSAATTVQGNTAQLVVATGFSVASSTLFNTDFILLNPATTIATGTVNLPCNAPDSFEYTISSTNQITALTVAGCTSPADSVFIGVNPFTLAQGNALTMRYIENANAWVTKSR